MTFRVLVTDKVALSGLYPIVDDDDFEVTSVDDSSTDEFATALSETQALIVRSATRVTRDLIERGSHLRAIGRAGVGVDNVDISAASDRGIAVFNAPGGNTIAAVELTMALLISVARKIPAAEASVRAGEWERASFEGVELRGKTLGLIGAGRIGGEVAIRCQAFGMSVIVYDPYLTQQRADELNCELVHLDDVLDVADFISIHVPLTEETRGIVGEKAFRRMKPTAFVVNASRGGVVDEPALAAALANGEIAGAALDVFETEPLPDDSPLRSAPNLVLTPHLGASTAEAQEGVATEVAEKIRALLVDGDGSGAINAGALR
ncbi:MAG TPA: hydroxyacid dehydrogenase [Acidimicrobiia bacterium]|nr:hydroxyacid dehydrogenase [Acidimicrobiia bacterium]